MQQSQTSLRREKLLDLNDVVGFISNKLDNFERGRLEKNYKRIKGRIDISEGKSGRYNTGHRQVRVALSERLPVNT